MVVSGVWVGSPGMEQMFGYIHFIIATRIVSAPNNSPTVAAPTYHQHTYQTLQNICTPLMLHFQQVKPFLSFTHLPKQNKIIIFTYSTPPPPGSSRHRGV
jgi:hypothetical protein